MNDLNPMSSFAESLTPKRALTYLRVSTSEQANKGGQSEGFSIPAQRDANKKKAQSLGAVVAKEFAERGVSGTSTNPQLSKPCCATSKRSKECRLHHRPQDRPPGPQPSG